MNHLRILLPDAPADAGIPLRWALLDRGGRVVDEGEGPAASLPAAATVCGIVSAGRVTAVRAVLPSVKGARLEVLLPFLVEDAVADDPAGLQVVPIRPRFGAMTTLHVVSRAWLQGWTGVLANAGRPLTQAIAEFLLLPSAAPDWTVAADGNGTLLRSGAAEGASLDAPEGAEPPIGLRLALDAARRDGELPRGIVLCPGESTGADTAKRWSDVLGVPVRIGAPWDWRTAPIDTSANLLAAANAVANREALWRRLRPGIAAGIAALAVHAVASGIDWYRDVRQRDDARAAMRATFQSAFPESRNIVDPALQMARKLEEARRASGEIADTDLLGLLAAMERAGRKVPPAAVQGVRFREGVLELDLAPVAAREAGAVADTLRSQGFAGTRVDADGKDAAVLRIARHAP